MPEGFMHGSERLSPPWLVCHLGIACSPLHFFRLGIAHILLLGLVKDFWDQFLPRPQDVRMRGEIAAHMVLPKEIRKAIEQKAPLMQATSAITKPYVDIVGCALPHSSCTG